MATYPYTVIWLADGADNTVAARCKGVARGVGSAASAYELVCYGGDVYSSGSTTEFGSADGFDYVYGDNWNTGTPQGKFLLDKMAHVPGNHEYRTVDSSRRPSGFNGYWTGGAPARTSRSFTVVDTTRSDTGPTINALSGTTAQQVVNSDWSHFGYLDILDWRFVWLDTGHDSLIDETGSFPSAGDYYNAVAPIINAKTDRRLVIFTHFPRWTSSSAHPASESATGLGPLWSLAAAKAIAYFAGHVHQYERFSPLNASGTVVAQASGCVEVNAGNAGRSLTGFGTATTGSAVRDATIFGFCKLTVDQNSLVIEHWSCGTDGLQTATLFDTVTLTPTTTLGGGSSSSGSDSGSGASSSLLAAALPGSDSGVGASGAFADKGGQVARPVLDLVTGGWGAAPLYPSVNDISDATFITGVASTGTTAKTGSDTGSATDTGAVDTGGAIEFQATYETNDFSQWTTPEFFGQQLRAFDASSNPVNDQSIVTDRVKVGTHAARFELRNGWAHDLDGTSRTEIARFYWFGTFNRELQEGDDLYFGWWSYFDSAFPNETGKWALFTQWKQDGSGSPPLEVDCGSDQGDQYIDLRDGVSNTQYWRQAMVRSQWLGFVVHVHFSSDPDIGFVEIWRDDGSGVFTKKTMQNGLTRTYAATLDSGADSYFKQGYYRDPTHTGTGVIWNDQTTVSSSLSTVVSALGGTLG